MGKYCKMLLLLSLLLIFSLDSTGASQGEQDECLPYPTCTTGGPEIRFPFRLKGRQPERCGLPGFELSCNSDGSTVLNLPSYPEGLFIRSICYEHDRLFFSVPDGCTKAFIFNLNLSSSPFTYFRHSSWVPSYTPQCSTLTYPSFDEWEGYFTFVNCSKDAVTEDAATEYDYLKEISSCSSSWDRVLFVPSYTSLQDVLSCTKLKSVVLNSSFAYKNSVNEYDRVMYSGLRWSIPGCVGCEGVCRYKNKWSNQTECHIHYQTKGALLKKRISIGTMVGFLLLLLVIAMAFKVFRSWKSSREKHRKVEEFLEDYKTRKPTRFNYSDVKRMTNQFKTKLGQGAYGSVYKGNLPNETPVAVKILKDSIGDGGGDFINEVGTIGRIHHANVVRLLGFCADGINRALIYEFMPNESLDKLIFAVSPEKVALTWEKLQRIAMGIARGIEYLHQGCEQQILHFDIKPNNILLDSNFNPKISDFGLAKLCSKEQSNVSITAARGTMGYIAPEVFSRNIGKVSYKSDVYSFGMLLLEMVGGRKNTDATVENPSRVYFPEWVYNHLNQEQEGGVGNEMIEEGDGEIVKKLTVVGLWCIQWFPVDRPSMKSVVQMLEGGIQSLTIPPNPFVSVPPRNIVNATMSPKNPIGSELTVISE